MLGLLASSCPRSFSSQAPSLQQICLPAGLSPSTTMVMLLPLWLEFLRLVLETIFAVLWFSGMLDELLLSSRAVCRFVPLSR